MKKYIDIPLETLERLVEGKCVEGSLRRDQFTGKITFRAYLRQSRMHQKDKLIKKLPWGWVKESMERIKVFGSFPKDMGTAMSWPCSTSITMKDAIEILVCAQERF